MNSNSQVGVDSPHFMWQEIHQQPDVLATCLSQSLAVPVLPLPSQIHILACGSSRHAGLVAQYWFEQVARIPTRVRSASEYVAAPLPLVPDTLTIALTQSGETSDTLTAVDRYRQQASLLPFASRLRLLGITNQLTSSLAQRVDQVLPTLAGAEIGIAATKTFTSQLGVLAVLMVGFVQRSHTLPESELQQLVRHLRSLPQQIQSILEQDSALQQLAAAFVLTKHSIVLGQGVNRAIALEGALKLKETTYIHAEGYAAGEFLHGPIALIDSTIPVIAIAPPDHTWEQVMTTVQGVRSYGAPVIGITTATNPVSTCSEFAHLIALPDVHPLLSPFLTVIPLQLLAYHIAVQRGLNVDKPRNIQKVIKS